jgi:DNA-binding NarL/FixJ family response regulator
VLDLVQLSMKVMVLSMYSKEQNVIRSLRDGASAATAVSLNATLLTTSLFYATE